jgi:hypothetical protein
VHGIGIVRYPDAVSGQLVPKAYRPGAGDRRRSFQSSHPLGEFSGPVDERLPDPLAPIRVERREDLAAIAVEYGQSLPLDSWPGADPPGERIERADAGRRQTRGGAQPTGCGDADPQAGERARAEADRDPVDLLPAAGGRGGALDLFEQRRRVPGPARRRQPQPRLVQSVAVAPGAGGGVGGCGVEADDEQRVAAPTA